MQTTIQLVHKIVDIACEMPRASLLRLTPYQHLIWAMDAKRGKLERLLFDHAAHLTNSAITRDRTMPNAMAECHLVS